MKKNFLIILLFACTNCIGQRKVSVYADFHVNSTLYDRTFQNNKGGPGTGLQLLINTKSKFNPTLEATSDLFTGNKILYLTTDDRPIYGKDFVGSILAGASYNFSQKAYFNIATGPSFFNSKTYLSIKPSAGIRFPASRRFVFKISFTHIFQHDGISSEGFGFFNFGLGIRLF